MGTSTIAPPPGFVLEQPSLPPPPPGFQLEGQVDPLSIRLPQQTPLNLPPSRDAFGGITSPSDLNESVFAPLFQSVGERMPQWQPESMLGGYAKGALNQVSVPNIATVAALGPLFKAISAAGATPTANLAKAVLGGYFASEGAKNLGSSMGERFSGVPETMGQSAERAVGETVDLGMLLGGLTGVRAPKEVKSGLKSQEIENKYALVDRPLPPADEVGNMLRKQMGVRQQFEQAATETKPKELGFPEPQAPYSVTSPTGQRVFNAPDKSLETPSGKGGAVTSPAEQVLTDPTAARLFQQEGEVKNAKGIRSNEGQLGEEGVVAKTSPQTSGYDVEQTPSQRPESVGQGEKKQVESPSSTKLYGGFPVLDPEFWKSQVGFAKTAKVDAMQLYNRVRNKLGQDSGAWEAVKDILPKVGKISPEEAQRLVEEKGQKVEVRKFGATKQTAESSRAKEIRHELDTLGAYHAIAGDSTIYRDEGRGLWRKPDTEPLKVQTASRLIDEYNKLPLEARRADLGFGERTNWQSIAPKPESSMPGYVEIAVVKPTVKSSADDKTGYVMEKHQFPSSHNFPPNTLGFVRGYMETLPDGKKAFHVIEVQSDWAQQARDTANARAQHEQQTGYKAAYERDISDPLLKHWDRLALKAAIEHAREQGADRIVISDAETAMMTEGHDQVTQRFGTQAMANEYTKETGISTVKQGDVWVANPSQSQGMRLNYDQILPKIVEELTGSKGERVSLGEHKNAFKQHQGEVSRIEGQSFPRENLIFRNPDNTPKTNVSGLAFDLSKAPKEFSLYGKYRVKAVETPKATEPSKAPGIKITLGKKTEEGLGPSLEPLKEAWDKAAKFVRSGGPKERISALLDAADNGARLFAREQANRIRVGLPSKIDRNALTFVIEAGGDRGKLADFLAKVSGTSAEQAVRFAQSNWDRLKPFADAAKAQMDAQRTREVVAGVQTDEVPNYIKHAYETERPDVFFDSGGGTGVSTSFKKQRVFPTYADAIEAGFKPKTLDAADLIDSRIAAGSKMVNRVKWGEHLGELVDPTDKQPLAKPLERQPKGTFVAPKGYNARELLPGVRLAVKDGYTDIFDALTGTSDIQRSALGRFGLSAEGFLKHGLLLFDSFHASRMLQKEFFMTGKVGYNKAFSLLEYDLPTIKRLVAQGDLPQEAGAWATRNKPTYQLLVKNGLNVGRIGDALYSNVIRKELPLFGVDLNVPGRFNKWVFDKVTRGAMTEAALSEFERTKKNNPSWSDEKVASVVSKQINVYFGNLMRQGLLKSATKRDIAQLVFLAPQWVEGMAQTELRAAGQVARMPLDAAREQTIKVGSLAKGVGAGLGAYFVAAQIINKFTRGQFTWENEEKDHKLDAWIPDPTGKTSGFFLSPMSVAAEVSHDWWRYSHTKRNQLEVASQILANKLSPLARTEETLRTQRDFAGNKLLGTKAVLKQAGKSMLPVPLPVSGATSEVPGQTIRQLVGSAGVKIEPANEREEKSLKQGKLSLLERAKTEKKEVKEPLSLDRRFIVAQKATEREFIREKALEDALSSKTKDFVEKNKLVIRGYAPEFSRGRIRTKLSEEEDDQMRKFVVQHYEEALESLQEYAGYENRTPKQKQKQLDFVLEIARRRADTDFMKWYKSRLPVEKP